MFIDWLVDHSVGTSTSRRSSFGYRLGIDRVFSWDVISLSICYHLSFDISTSMFLGIYIPRVIIIIEAEEIKETSCWALNKFLLPSDSREIFFILARTRRYIADLRTPRSPQSPFTPSEPMTLFGVQEKTRFFTFY
jgi:hypothetical protein